MFGVLDKKLQLDTRRLLRATKQVNDNITECFYCP